MEEEILNSLQCSFCDAPMAENQVFCVSCGFPEKGTEQERSKFHANRILEMRKSSDARSGISSARNTLFIIAALTMLWGIFYFFQLGKDSEVLITYTILSVMYLMLGYWSQQKPLVALILGLLVYITIIVIAAIFDPSTIFSGIIVKAFVIIYLGKGINSALHLKKQTK